MKIAICDDEPVFLEKLKKHILMILKNEQCIIDMFSSGNNLLEEFSINKYNVIILDIEMTGLNGIDTAKEIRNIDRDVTIAFLTSYEDFALQGYDVKAERYILKQQPEQIYNEQLTALFNEYNQRHKKFNYSNNNRAFSVKLSDIMYFEVYVRTIIVHTIEQKYEFYGKISDIEDQLKYDGFIRVGKSFLVNISNIKFIEKNNIRMKDDTFIQLGRSVRTKVVEKYLEYLSGR